ncbi:hypothetical protein HSBAA_22130 [Vreelandella sulfidaeris]|uniref:Uncharacterized protein n=1 Tax=Vreelandella sulfidaeris TaxID=115553 RepID=A0A455U5V5_9GAMM|nr:hypothetical protein HSBAA_22130 [Halomonas sulfidaeris]
MYPKPTLRPLGAAIAAAVFAGLPAVTTADTGPELSQTEVLSGLENPLGYGFFA